MEATVQIPTPFEDADNRSFLTTWQSERRIVLQKSPAGKPFFYPRPMCPYTGSAELEEVPASGRGRIVSFSLVRRPNHPAFNDDVPIVLAEIELEEGALMLGRIITEDPENVKSGSAVTVITDAPAGRYPLPVFELD